MDSAKELAATNIKISEAKNIIFKLQEDETTYLEEREKKALVRIDKVLDDSRDLLAKAHENYNEVHEFCRTINEFASFLSETQSKFQDLLTEFKDRDDAWGNEVKRREKEFADLRTAIDIDKTIIENDKKTIEKAKESIEKDKAVIESRQHQIKVALEVLNKKQK